MQRFCAMFGSLDRDGGTNHKVDVLVTYFRQAPPDDAVWALYLLTGRKLKRVIKRQQLFDLVQKVAHIPAWLFEECYAVAGDLAETCALLWPATELSEAPSDQTSLRVWMEERCPALTRLDGEAAQATLCSWLHGLAREEVFLAIKLLTGGFRAGVAQGLVVKALAKAFGHDAPYWLESLSGDWPVTGAWFASLITANRQDTERLSPLPFYLASPLLADPETLGSIQDYALEWKWDGIRAQIIKDGDKVAIWSRGEELISASFPELVVAATGLASDCILDGEILVFSEGRVRSFAQLQARLGRKKLTPKLLKELPVKFFAFDCLRSPSGDLRGHPFAVRRAELLRMIADNDTLTVTPHLSCSDWQAARAMRAESKAHGVEGLMLKRLDAPYRMGRKRGDFWKWKIDPMTLDAVLVYAQAGHGRRATLYTDYTFALWHGEQLVPFAKAYSGLDDAAIRELDTWIRKHTRERFGPVRSVEPLRVFEIAFEGITHSTRHKSGLAVRFPRILRERSDKPAHEADTIERARALIPE